MALVNLTHPFLSSNSEWILVHWCNYAHSLGTNQEATCFRVLNITFTKRFIKRLSLNRYMRFNLNDSEDLVC